MERNSTKDKTKGHIARQLLGHCGLAESQKEGSTGTLQNLNERE